MLPKVLASVAVQGCENAVLLPNQALAKMSDLQRGMGGKGKYVIQGYVECREKSSRAGSDEKEEEPHAVIIIERVNLGAYIFYGYNRQVSSTPFLDHPICA